MASDCSTEDTPPAKWWGRSKRANDAHACYNWFMKFIYLTLALCLVAFAQAELDRVRQVNLETGTKLPSFVADETLKRYEGRIDSSKWRQVDTVDTEIAVEGTAITRQNWRRNGKPWKPASGFIPNAGFGAELKPLFSPECPTRLESAGSEAAGGKQVLAYRFSSPPNSCFVPLGINGQTYNAARSGRILVDDRSGRMIQFEAEATGFPKGFDFVQRNEVETWDYVKIGDASHLLPVSADFIWRMPNGALYRVAIEYRNHRHFEASTNLTFEKEEPNKVP